MILATIALASANPSALPGQDTAPGAVVRVRVVADAAPVTDARVRAHEVSRRTDGDGIAVLRLPPGTHRLTASRLGFAPDSATISLREGQDTSVTLTLVPREGELENVVVRATRSERRIEQTPLRVEVLAREEVEEKMLMTPGDITMMLNETGGLRVQITSPSLGGANVRVHGLRGRYTLMLADGLPLFGGQSGALGLLQIPPMDLAQVEVVKGVASALYGSSALGGVINLVTRRPSEVPERELLLNQTTQRGTDAILWSSQEWSDALGYTLLAGGHRQRRVDVDEDGWTDLPGHDRLVVRPRLFWRGAQGRSAMITVGTTAEDRRGGTMNAALAPDGMPHLEALRTRRYDGGGVARLPFGSSVFSFRASGSAQQHRHRFGGVQERDVHDTWFTEASLATNRGRHTTVVGAAFQQERYRGTEVTNFDYTYRAPAVFGQHDVDVTERLALSASARADVHSEYGTLFNPRVSALYRIADGWTVRASGGTGAFAPTPFTEEAEATGLTPVRIPNPLRVERAISTSVDAGGAVGPLEVNVTAFASRIRHPLAVRPAASDPLVLEVFSATHPTRTAGADALLRYHNSDVTTTLSYTFVNSTEQHPNDPGQRRAAPLAPRHTAGLTSVWELEDRARIGLEYYYTGRQPLSDNPYRAISQPYSVFGAIGEWHLGRTRLFINLENLGDVRLSRYHPLVRPTRGEGGRWTTDAWAPLEGRVINGGVRLDL